MAISNEQFDAAWNAGEQFCALIERDRPGPDEFRDQSELPFDPTDVTAGLGMKIADNQLGHEYVLEMLALLSQYQEGVGERVVGRLTILGRQRGPADVADDPGGGESTFIDALVAELTAVDQGRVLALAKEKDVLMASHTMFLSWFLKRALGLPEE